MYVILFGLLGFAVLGLGLQIYLEEKYKHLLGSETDTPQQPAATQEQPETAATEETNRPRRFAFMMRMRPAKKAGSVTERKEAA